MINYLINFATIGLAIIIGIILCLILFSNSRAIQVSEHRKWILITEIILMLIIIIVAIYNIVTFILF